jgi:hypothetical protein
VDIPCNQSARAIKAIKAANKKNNTRRERHTGSFTANTGLEEKETPLPAAVREECEERLT